MNRILCLAACLLCVSVNASAGGMIGFGVQATGGGISVADPFKDVYGAGFGGGAHVDINLPVLFSIRVSGDYVVFSPDNEKYKAVLVRLIPGSLLGGFAVDGGKINILSISANGKLGLPTPLLSPYLTAGIGLSSFSGGDLSVSYNGTPLGQTPGVNKETVAAVNFGAGADLNILITVYLEAKYTVAFTAGSSSSYTLVSLGVTF